MKSYAGRVVEVREEEGGTAATIACPARAVPAPGQYLLGAADEDVLGAALFFSGAWPEGFQAAPPLPVGWEPGTILSLHGPLGHGFRLPLDLRRLALAATGEGPARLLPLAEAALSRNAAVTLYSDLLLPDLPTALEAFPLAALPEALTWADFLVVDTPLKDSAALGERLGLPPGSQPPCPGQVLVYTPMPCAGFAECGACAVHSQRGWKLACVDGPVFDLKEIISET
jgi:hypothetical protein